MTLLGQIRIRQWVKSRSEDPASVCREYMVRSNTIRSKTISQISDDLDARRALDEFDFITVGSVDEYEAAARGCCGGSIGNRDSLCGEGLDRVVEVVDLKSQMHQVFLNPHRSTRREAAEFDQFLAIRHLEKRQMGSARRDLALQDFQS